MQLKLEDILVGPATRAEVLGVVPNDEAISVATSISVAGTTESAMRLYGAALLGLGLTLGIASQASAATCTGAGIYNSSNGTAGNPGTSYKYAGIVGGSGTLCQIGIVDPSPPPASAAEVNSGTDPSNYEIYYDGGNLTITEQIGSEGTNASQFLNIGVELYSLSGTTATLVTGASMEIVPISGSPSLVDTLISGDPLSAGDYVISTYCLNAGCVTTGNLSVDPQFQINFTSSGTVTTGDSSLPEPASLALFGAGLAGLGFLRRRRPGK